MAQRQPSVTTLLEQKVLELLEHLAGGGLPRWKVRARKWENADMVNGILTPITNENADGFAIVDGSTPQGLLKFTRMAFVLFRVYRHLSSSSRASGFTKRDLYYQNPALFGHNQRTADAAIEDVCCFLKVSRKELGISATAKGLVAGPGVKLRLPTTNQEVLLDAASPTEINDEITSAIVVDSEAEFILVVEKEASFDKILSSGFLRTWPCILITGKGYPDLATRLFTKNLADTLRCPVLALVDGDPHGIEIMSNYKCGSLGLLHENENATISNMTWLGVKPSDVEVYKIPEEAQLPLTDKDRAKIVSLNRSPVARNWEELRRELRIIQTANKKVEIQSLDAFGVDFLCSVYLPHKFSVMGFRFRKFPSGPV